jgi:hypothetical protein
MVCSGTALLYLYVYVYIHVQKQQYMYIISALDLCGLFSSRTPMEHHTHPLGGAHPTLGTTALE